MSQNQLRGKLIPKQTLRGHIHRSAGIDDYEKLRNKPQINGVELSGDLSTEDLGITEPVNADWNASEGLAKILNKPTIPAAQVNSDWNATDGVAKILNKPTIPAAQVNSDWDATDGVAKILNKPAIYTQDEVDDIIDGLLPVDEADGSVASFSTDLAKPLISLKADVNAIQDLNGQSGAYVAGGQLWDETWEVGDYDSSGNKRAYNTRIRCKDQIAVSPNTTYCFYMKTTSGIAWQFYDTNHNFISQQSRASGQGGFEFTTPNDCYYMTFGTWDDYGNTYKNDISINSNRTDKSYHPYSNICPIYGRSAVKLSHLGENVFDAITWATLDRNPNFYSVSSNQEITVLANDGSGIAQRLIDVIPNATYSYMSTFASAIRIFNSSGSTISNKTSDTFTTPADGKIAVKFYASTYPTTGKFILSMGSIIPTIWSAYTGTTEVIDLGDTIYGGYITQDNNGLKLVVTHSNLTLLNSLTWYPTVKQDNTCFYADLPNGIIKTGGEQLYSGLCETYRVTNDFNMSTNNSVVFYCSSLYGGYTRVLIRDNSASTMTGAEFKEYVSGKILYPINTPIEIPLSDIPEIVTLIGTNNIFADSGDVEVKFKESIQKYIDDKIADTQALIL